MRSRNSGPLPTTGNGSAPSHKSLSALVSMAALALCVTGCARSASAVATKPPARRPEASASTSPPEPTPSPTPVPTVAATPSPRPGPACKILVRHFPCKMQKRFRKVERYLGTQPGMIGLVLHDRATGGTWDDGDYSTEMPAASTIKLAVVMDLLLRSQAGQIQLTSYDWNLIYNALHESSDVAADQLWFSFEDGTFLQRIQKFGMQGAEFTSKQPYWGYMYCTPEDLDNLMNYVLDDAPARDRSYLVHQLRHVAPIQQWGVWGAGRAQRPGNKDGWEDDSGVWIVNTVGFAGPHERYTLAIMDNLGGSADFSTGTDTLSQVASLLFRGKFGPAPTAVATP